MGNGVEKYVYSSVIIGNSKFDIISVSERTAQDLNKSIPKPSQAISLGLRRPEAKSNQVSVGASAYQF